MIGYHIKANKRQNEANKGLLSVQNSVMNISREISKQQEEKLCSLCHNHCNLSSEKI